MGPTVEATFWGFVSGGALVIGAAVGYFVKVPGKVVAGVMAFGSGVLISALSFELMEEAFQEAGMTATATGFLLGAAIYVGANRLLAIWGAKHRKRSGDQQPMSSVCGRRSQLPAVWRHSRATRFLANSRLSLSRRRRPSQRVVCWQ